MANVAKANEASPASDVVLGQLMGELGGRDAEADHKREVEQQLQRRRGPVRLMRVAPGHAANAMHLDRAVGRVRLDLTHDLQSVPSQRRTVQAHAETGSRLRMLSRRAVRIIDHRSRTR